MGASLEEVRQEGGSGKGEWKRCQEWKRCREDFLDIMSGLGKLWAW
jgi:hypothetical protein